MSMGMTPREADLLRFLRQYRDSHDGVMPTFDEMCVGLGLGSKSGIGRLIDGLVTRKRLRRIAGANRALEIIEDAVSRIVDQGLRSAFADHCAETKAQPDSVIEDALREYLRNRGRAV